MLMVYCWPRPKLYLQCKSVSGHLVSMSSHISFWSDNLSVSVCVCVYHKVWDIALLWSASLALWSRLYRHYEYQLKILSFFYLGQIVLSPGDDPTELQIVRHQYPMHSFRYFSNKMVEIAVFCCGYQTRSMVEAQKLPLHVCLFNVWT